MQQQGSGNPPNGYDINPMMMQALSEIQPEQLPMMLMSNPEMFPEKNRNVFWKIGKNTLQLTGLGFVAGCAINIGIKRVNIKFLNLPAYVRLPARLFLFAVPYGLLFGKLNDNFDKLNDNFADIHLKLMRLQRTGNIQQYMGA